MSTSLRLAKLATNLDANGDVTSVGGLTYPSADGTAGQVVTTDGAGTLSFADASGGSSFTVSLFHTLDNPNWNGSGNGDQFGFSVAISGNYAIVGAWLEDDAGGGSSGIAYIFNVTTGARVHTLDNPNGYDTSANDYFGHSVAISGNYAIVGAPFEDDAGGSASGKAYIFDVTTGTLVHTLDNPNAYDTSVGDQFGYSVAISGNYAIVGAKREDDAGGVESGKAYIFDVTTGTLVHTLDNPSAYGTSAYDEFGHSVAISGNYAIVGAHYEGQNAQEYVAAGKAYIFNVTTGALVHTLDNPNPYDTSINDFFGHSVALSGNYAIVSAFREDDAGSADSGKAYIFNVATGALLYTLDNPTPGANDEFGNSVAISGNYAIVGAKRDDDAGDADSGKAYIFEVSSGTLVATIDNPTPTSTGAGDEFGSSVAISGNYAIVGAYNEDEPFYTNPGKSYIYQLPTAEPYALLDSIEAAGFSGGISNVVEDTTPQLGGDLDLNSKSFSGTASFKSGSTEMLSITDGAALTMVESNAWPLLINTDNSSLSLTAGTSESGGGSITLRTENQSRIAIANTGPITFNNSYTFPTADGTAGQVLTTDGAGTLSFADASGGSSGSSFTASLFHTLDNPNPEGTSADDNFGWSVAVSGNYAVVGAYNEDDAGGLNSGKAYIYNVSTGALVATLDNPNAYNTSASDNFGYSVAISGNYAIVSAYKEDDAGGNDSGKAYIFNVTTGALVHTLDNPNAYSTSSNDRFGNSVAISGNYAIVGVSYEDDAGGLNSGKAYIFNVTTGALVHTLDNPSAYSTSDIDNFGTSVAISGNYAIVGAWFEDDAGGSDSGKAYIYNVSTGALVHTLDNPNAYDTSASDEFGNSVAISGNYAIVGAWFEDDGGLNSGKAYIFNVSTGALLHTLDNPNAYSTSTTDNFGTSVAISGNYAIVGARLEDDASGGNSGKAYIFDVTTGTLVATLDNPSAYSTSLDDRFGKAVTISGNYAIVGAWQEDDAGGANSGKAYIYQLPNAQPYVLDAAEAVGFSSGGGSSGGGSFADRYVAAILF